MYGISIQFDPCPDSAGIAGVHESEIVKGHEIDERNSRFDFLERGFIHPDFMTESSRLHWSADLLAFYLGRKLLRRKTPLIANVKLTYRCNLRCGACPFHRRAKEPNAHMTWETAVNALSALRAMGCRLVVFEGGEPLLWRDGPHDFASLAEFAKKRFLRVAVTTNGTFPIDVPTDIVWVSLDGLKPTHDRLRSDSFDAAWRNLQAARHPRVLIHFTLNRENWRDLEGLMEVLRGVPAVRGMTVQLFYPYGQEEIPLALDPKERKAALEAVIRMKRRGCPILNSEGRLRAMIANTWKCRDDILVNVDPDGQLTQGCYVKSRGRVHCSQCGFTPVAEASGAIDLLPGAIAAGWRIFLERQPALVSRS